MFLRPISKLSLTSWNRNSPSRISKADRSATVPILRVPRWSLLPMAAAAEVVVWRMMSGSSIPRLSSLEAVSGRL